MERTYLSEVYEMFLTSISDYQLASRDNEEIKEDLWVWFKKAKPQFYKCKKPLELLEDENGEKYFGYIDKNGNSVDVKLDDFEILILSNLMVVEYLKPYIVSSDTINMAVGDKDFKIFSQANHMRELSDLYNMLKKETKKMIRDYTYRKTGDGKK